MNKETVEHYNTKSKIVTILIGFGQLRYLRDE